MVGEVVIAGFGKQLDGYLDQLARLHPGAKLMLLSPTAVEKGGQALDIEGRHRNVAAYAQVLGEFFAPEARMKVAGGKLGETKRTHRIRWRWVSAPRRGA